MTKTVPRTAERLASRVVREADSSTSPVLSAWEAIASDDDPERPSLPEWRERGG